MEHKSTARAFKRYEEISKLLAAGITQAEIARLLNISRQRINQLHVKYKDYKTPNYRPKNLIKKYVPLRNEFGVPIVKILRVYRGISSDQLVNMTNVSHALISRLENNQYQLVKQKVAEAIASALDLSVDLLFFELRSGQIMPDNFHDLQDGE